MSYTVTHTRESCPLHGHMSSECDDRCRLVEETYEVTGSVSRYVPAKVSGPPERCYPAEGGEVEIEDCNLLSEDGKTRRPIDWENHFTPKELEDIEQRLFDAMTDDDGDGYEPDYDYDEDYP